MPSDEELVAQMKKGSGAALSEVVRRHQDAVYSLCYRMTGDAAEAEDLAQEAFLRFQRSLAGFRPGARVRPWLRKITANLCLDALRKRKHNTVSLDDLSEGNTEPPTPHGDDMPEVAFLSREARLDVQQALLRLPGEYRAVLVLRYLEDLSYQEVADAIGAPVTTVETRIFRAKRMLGRMLASPQGGKEEA